MPDRDKVIKGFECCVIQGFDCYNCTYGDATTDLSECHDVLLKDALELLKEQKSEWLEDSDPGQEYGTTWACAECGHSIHEHTVWNPYKAGFKYCPFCGDRMALKRDD